MVNIKVKIMDDNIKAILDNYEISEEQYWKIYEYLKSMDAVYHDTNELSRYNYESYVTKVIGNKYSHYPAEDLAVELYRLGEFQDLIKNIIKVLCKLNL